MATCRISLPIHRERIERHLATRPIRATDRFSVPGSKLAPAYNTAGTNTFPDFSQGDDYEPSGVYQVRKEDPAFADNFTKVVGSHTLKFGAFTQNTANYQGGGQQMNGIFSFGQNQNPFLGHIVGFE